MRLILSKPIRGFKNRGTEDEKSFMHADVGERVIVVFNNTFIDKNEKLVGHYVCVPIKTSPRDIIEEGLHFIVFPSQVKTILRDRYASTEKEEKEETINNDEIENDPLSTLLSDICEN